MFGNLFVVNIILVVFLKLKCFLFLYLVEMVFFVVNFLNVLGLFKCVVEILFLILIILLIKLVVVKCLFNFLSLKCEILELFKKYFINCKNVFFLFLVLGLYKSRVF